MTTHGVDISTEKFVVLLLLCAAGLLVFLLPVLLVKEDTETLLSCPCPGQ